MRLALAISAVLTANVAMADNCPQPAKPAHRHHHVIAVTPLCTCTDTPKINYLAPPEDITPAVAPVVIYYTLPPNVAVTQPAQPIPSTAWYDWISDNISAAPVQNLQGYWPKTFQAPEINPDGAFVSLTVLVLALLVLRGNPRRKP